MKRIAMVFGLCAFLPTLVLGQQIKSGETPYFPLKVGSKWTYQSKQPSASKAAEKQTVIIEVEKSETIIYKTKGVSGAEIENKVAGFELKVTSGENKMLKEKIAILENGVYRFEAASKEISPPLCIFMLPIEKNAAWAIDSMSNGTRIQGTFERVGEENLQTPAGNFKALHIRAVNFQVGNSTQELDTWYVPRIGMVKQRVKVGTLETILELENYQP